MPLVMHESSILRRIFFLLIFLSAITLAVDLHPAIRIPLAFLQAFYLPGIVWMGLVGGDRRSPLESLFLPPVLSPIVIVLLMLAFHPMTGSFAASLKLSFGALYILCAVVLARRGRAGSETAPPVPNGILWTAVLFAAVIVIAYLVNDYLFAWDTPRHAAIAGEILYRDIPPKEPFFADIPIRTMWFYHLFQAVWKQLSGLSIFHAMWLFNVMTAFSFAYIAARLASCFTKKAGRILLAPLLSFAGLYSAAWVFWPLNFARALSGEVRGRAEIAQILGEINLNGKEAISLLAPPLTFPINMFDRFITTGIFPYTMCLFLLCFMMSVGGEAREKAKSRTAATILLLVAGCFMFRLVVGTALILTIILGAAIFALTERLRKRSRRHSFQTLVVPMVAAAAGILGGLYYHTLTDELRTGLFLPERMGVSVASIATIVLPLIALLPFSLRALRKAFSSHTPAHGMLASWMTALAALAVVVDLKGTLESFYIFLLFLLLAPLVAIEIAEAVQAARGTRRAILIAWIAILFVVPSVVSVRGLMLDKPKSQHHRRRYYLTSDQRSIYSWIRDSTGADAVIVEKNEFNVMPFYTNRRNFYMTGFEQRNFGYRGERVRYHKEIRDRLYSSDPLDTDIAGRLGGFGFDIYLVLWKEDLEENPELSRKFSLAPEFAVRYENPAGTVYVLVR